MTGARAGEGLGSMLMEWTPKADHLLLADGWDMYQRTEKNLESDAREKD